MNRHLHAADFQDMQESMGIRPILLASALVYTVFVIYGSLVPLEYRALGLDEAITQFRQIRFIRLGIGSRADWMANLLLFVPLTFLWVGTLAYARSFAARLLVSMFVVLFAVLLSVGIEFTQLYFPQRTVSLNDLFAEALGGLIGVALWWMAGARFTRWLAIWKTASGHLEIIQRLTLVYLLLLFGYSLLPLDLTLSPVEVFHKFREGKLNLLPFASLPGEPVLALYELASDSMLWLVPALLWRWSGKASSLRVWVGMTGAALLLEILQLFVYSRVSDLTDIFTAAAGAAMGVWLANMLRRHAQAPPSRSDWAVPAMPLLLAAVWIVLIFAVFWYPFDFRADGSFLRGRLHHFLTRVPFEAYYFGTEYRAATEVLHKVLFFIPLGAMLGWFVSRLRYMWRGYAAFFSMSLIACGSLVVVAGRLAQPEKNPDIMDIVLQWLGGLAGYLLAWKVFRMRPPVHSPIIADQPPAPPKAHAASLPVFRGQLFHGFIAVFCMALAFWAARSVPSIPYNVRELFWPSAPFLTALLLAVNCYWLASWPVWLARRRVSGGVRLLQLPAGLLVYGVVDFIIVYSAVPLESLHDLVGSPVLNWSWHWELLWRWVALVSIPGTVLYLAVQTVRRRRGLQLGLLHFIVVVPILALAYWGVVTQAATDNLVELLASPNALAFLAVYAWLYTLLLAAALTASPLPKKNYLPRVLGVLGSLPLAALFLSLGLADSIQKYGQQFSALQFLLSADRQHYLNDAAVWFRYSIVHLLAVLAIASLQWPFYRSNNKPQTRFSHATH